MRSFKAVQGDLSELIGSLDVGSMSGDEAARQLSDLASVKKLIVGAELALVRRVDETGAWRASGAATAAEWLAGLEGSSKAEANRLVDTASLLQEQPALEEAVGRGELSERQAAAIAATGAVAPQAVASLVDRARTVSLRELQEECDRRRAAADRDAEARRARLHAQRSLRTWTAADGAFKLMWSGPPEVGAELLARLRPFRSRAFDEARRAGRRERPEAYDADALVGMARAASDAERSREDGPVARGATKRRTGRPAKVIARVDWSAVRRGHLHDGELCEIAGVGPVALSAARELVESGDSLLAAVLTDGVEVQRVVHAGRKLTAAQRTAMEWRDPQCIVLGCDRRLRLEIDHRADYAVMRHTTLDELEWKCEPHHDLKTYEGWQLEPGTGKRRLLPPGHPDYPGDPRGSPPPGRRRRRAR